MSDSESLVEVWGREVRFPALFVGPNEELWLTAPQMYGSWISGAQLMYKRSPDFRETWYNLEALYPKLGYYMKNKPLYLESENHWLLGADTYGIHGKPHFLLLPGNFHERQGDSPMLVGGDQIALRPRGVHGRSGVCLSDDRTRGQYPHGVHAATSVRERRGPPVGFLLGGL